MDIKIGTIYKIQHRRRATCHKVKVEKIENGDVRLVDVTNARQWMIYNYRVTDFVWEVAA